MSPDPLAIQAVRGGEALNSYHYLSGNLLATFDALGRDVEPASRRSSQCGRDSGRRSLAAAYADVAAADEARRAKGRIPATPNGNVDILWRHAIVLTVSSGSKWLIDVREKRECGE